MVGWIFTAAAVSTAFNLVCTGESYMSKNLLGPREMIKPATIEYRLDLAAGRWCQGNCESTTPIDTVGETAIVLSQSENSVGDDLTMINRETGALLSRQRLGSTAFIVTGDCKKAPFSGFPLRKF